MKNQEIALIQLVSEQTMQNVLPILALRPGRVVHLVTPKVAPRAAWIIEAARQSGVAVKAEQAQLSEMPTIQETAQEIAHWVSEARRCDLTPVINFTGGTKLMSIGAYAVASKEKLASLYVDTEHAHLTDGRTGSGLDEILQGEFSFTPYQRLLSLNAIAVANGCQRITGGKPIDAYVPLAELLLRSQGDERRSWEAMNDRDGLAPSGKEPRNAAAWLQLCSRPVELPAAIEEAAVLAGLLERGPEGVRIHCPARGALERLSRGDGRGSSEYFEAIRQPKFAITFLAGGWWEVAVAKAAQDSGRFRDIRWSVDAGQRGFGGSMEEDIVGVDGVRIAYFSCKRGGAKARLSRQLEEVHASAERLGGRFVSKYFCSYQPFTPSLKETLGRRSRELGIRLLTRDDLLRQDVFDSP